MLKQQLDITTTSNKAILFDKWKPTQCCKSSLYKAVTVSGSISMAYHLQECLASANDQEYSDHWSLDIRGVKQTLTIGTCYQPTLEHATAVITIQFHWFPPCAASQVEKPAPKTLKQKDAGTASSFVFEEIGSWKIWMSVSKELLLMSVFTGVSIKGFIQCQFLQELLSFFPSNWHWMTIGSTNPCQGVSITFSTYSVAFMIVIVLQSVINGRPSPGDLQVWRYVNVHPLWLAAIRIHHLPTSSNLLVL